MEKTWVEISRKNILNNIKNLKSLLTKNTKFMAVLKSNAYGHGLKEMNKICVQSEAIDWYGVDSIDEALLLRDCGNNKPILVLGYIPFDRVGEAAENNISFVAYNKELLDYLQNTKLKILNSKFKLHLKVETGTSRQGIVNQELVNFTLKVKKNPNIFLEGIYTHYANIEDTTDNTYAIKQLNIFNENIKKIEAAGINIPIKHSACSAALINYPKTHFNMVRSGISLYGMWSSQETKDVAKQKNIKLRLKPALTWKTRIAQIKKIKKETPVSYGLTERVKRDSIIAILPVGYYDGYDRGLSSIGEVLIRGKRAKVLGRVCMNMTIVDITDISNVRLNDEAMLLGKNITAESIADKLETINYEVVTRINPNIKRLIV